MKDGPKAMLRIVALLALGLGPSLGTLAYSPSRSSAIAAASCAAMAVGFVAWTHRLVADAHHLRQRDAALRNDVTSLEEKVQTQAKELRDVRACDDVTGVLNRSAFLKRLDEAVLRDARLGKSLAFLLLDIEGFRAINAERGRLGGDAVLQQIVGAIQGATRGTDFVGRLGGDEFGVVLNECEDPRPAVNRLFLALQARNAADPGLVVHVSVGAVTIENPAHGVDLAELFRMAEGALASVRGTGGSLCARRKLKIDSPTQAATA
jgi:diguanylate cyclase (GGDEF)-like protein